MTAITKSWTDIADSACDPDSPVTTGLVTGLRDNIIVVKEWLGQSFFAGRVQDHDHDGLNSAAIDLGSNVQRNGSFEGGLGGWTIADFTGGSHVISTAQHRHGKQSLTFTSTSTANGGGTATSGGFTACAEGEYIPWRAYVWASVANVSSRIELVWYDNTQTLISATSLYNVTNTPTSSTLQAGSGLAPATARYFKLRLTGGVPAAGSAFGTIRFDGVRANDALLVGQNDLRTATGSSTLALGSNAAGSLSLAGGTYSWWTGSASNGGGGPAGFGNGDTAAGVIGVQAPATGTTFAIDERYIQASPPYDLGDGRVGQFVWAMLGSGGELLGLQVAEDPPWAYRGAVSIKADYYVDDRPYARQRTAGGLLLVDALSQDKLRGQILRGEIPIETLDMEITDALKNSQMEMFAHPFIGNDMTGRTVVLLDPVSDLAHRLNEIAQSAGAREVADMVRDGYIDFDNTPLERSAPSSVISVSARLSNERRKSP